MTQEETLKLLAAGAANAAYSKAMLAEARCTKLSSDDVKHMLYHPKLNYPFDFPDELGKRATERWALIPQYGGSWPHIRGILMKRNV